MIAAVAPVSSVMKTGAVLCLAALVCGAAVFIVYDARDTDRAVPDELAGGKDSSVGSVIARYRGVPAYQNGNKVAKSHGRHYAANGYYYGQKWQCVEYVKRFYHDALGHRMPSVWGHARDFFDPGTGHGGINPLRGLVQYRNGGDMAPEPDDLLVFRTGNLGHVAIVTKVTRNSVEVVQQNIHGSPTSVHPLTRRDGRWTVGKDDRPAGWLRLPEPGR